jgi:acetyl-CoA acetyltransferase family protein
MKKVVIVAAKRSPISKIPGELNYINETELVALVVKDVSIGLEHHIDEAILGSSFPVERDNLCRKAIIKAGLSPKIPASTISKTCASSDEALLLGYNKIACLQAKAVLVCGSEKISNSSYALHFLKKNVKRSVQNSLQEYTEVLDGIQENDMVYINEMLAKKFAVSRREQDEFTIQSIRKAKKANQRGYFINEIVPVSQEHTGGNGLHTDEWLSLERKEEEVRSAPPMFIVDGCITQYNAAPISDVAVAMVLMEYDLAQKLGIKPMAFLHGIMSTGVENDQMGMSMTDCVKKCYIKTICHYPLLIFLKLTNPLPYKPCVQ